MLVGFLVLGPWITGPPDSDFSVLTNSAPSQIKAALNTELKLLCNDCTGKAMGNISARVGLVAPAPTVRAVLAESGRF